MKLDKTRPYGTCSENGASFEQDGILFDGNGNAVTSTAPQPATVPEKGKPGRKPKAQIDDQLAAQLGG